MTLNLKCKDPSAFGTNEEKPFNWAPDREPWSLKCPDDNYELVKTKASYVHKDDNKLSDKTICMTGMQGENNEYKHFDVHNLYGHVEMIPTYEAAKRLSNGPNKRGFVLSRSTYLGSGKYGGHWTGVIKNFNILE
jgi:alpha-glucosidase (family GH31 glycosyl hydrolase)